MYAVTMDSANRHTIANGVIRFFIKYDLDCGNTLQPKAKQQDFNGILRLGVKAKALRQFNQIGRCAGNRHLLRVAFGEMLAVFNYGKRFNPVGIDGTIPCPFSEIRWF